MAATVFNQAQLELLDMMQWVKSPEALAELKQVILQCKLGIELVRKEMIYVTKEDIQMPGMWVRDRNI